LRARVFGDEPTQSVLPLASILEEEFAALHPSADAPDTSYHATFTVADIADLNGFARALVDSTPANPLAAIGALVLRDQGELAQLLRTDDSRAGEALAARLTALLDEDLEHAEPFAPILRTIARTDDGSFAKLLQHERNRVLLETAFAPFVRTTLDRRMSDIIARIHAERHAALCLSGGGIRSASFAMGVVQGLAQRGLLRRFDYLSTVSGGGYTGSWLSAWMSRDGADRVHDQLSGAKSAKAETEPATLRHIRAFSYYLTPRFGLFSADTWTLIATMTRNILLIWLVTLPVIAAFLMLPRLFVAGTMTTLAEWRDYGIDPGTFISILGVIGTALAIIGIAFVQRNLYTYSGRNTTETASRAPATFQQFIIWCFAPLMIAMAALAQQWELMWSLIRLSPEDALRFQQRTGHALSHHAWADWLIRQDPKGLDAPAIAMAMGITFWVSVYVIAWLFSARGRSRDNRMYSLVLSIVCGALAGAIGAAASTSLFGLTEWRHPPEFFATFAVPMSLPGMLVSMHVVVGLASRRMTDAEREANARFSAWLLIGMIGWAGVVGLALYGPYILVGATIRIRHLVAIGGLSGLLASAVGASSAQGANSSSGASGLIAKAQKAMLAVAAPVFAATVVVLVALLNTQVLRVICGMNAAWCPADDPSGRTDLYLGDLNDLAKTDYASPLVVLAAFAGLLLLGYFFGRRIDTNRFSLHAMYRERLVRTFLGASRPPGERQPNPFTGFDARDDMPIGDLWPPSPQAGEQPAADSVHPPLHVVNVTLKTVAGGALATQNRKATSFTMTSLHSGSADVGYRRTCTVDGTRQRLYGGRDGVSLGTAVAISGAAASPNSGYHSSPAVTFLMTLFNARLGWWLGNPGPAGGKTFDDDEPKLALLPILDEMFGRTTDHSSYVYLSDGGHFENLGLYEMVRRRCRFIVVSDAGCDPTCCFDDLGGAIRKLRIDFGIPVEFPGAIPIYSRKDTNKPGARYWAVGRIRYSEVDGGGEEQDGYLLYIKPAFYGGEPYDVYNYANSTPDYPHESTGNQFFGEAQFESYRALGEFAVNQMITSDDAATRAALDEWSRAPIYSPPLNQSRTPVSAART
jgi:hypothetical protein